jgi:hypothetical protein
MDKKYDKLAQIILGRGMLNALKNINGRMLATLVGLVVVGVMNLVIAYNKRSLVDAIVVATIFLIILPYIVLRRFRSKQDGTNVR